MDRVVAYNIVLAHIPGKANAAADFLSRMQTDSSASLELQLVDSIPIKQIEIDMKAKTPDASMLMIESSNLNESEEPQMLIPKNLMENIQSNSALQKLIPNLKELLTSACDQYLPELYAVKQAPELNSIQEKDPLNFFHLTNSNAETLDIQAEQKRNPVL